MDNHENHAHETHDQASPDGVEPKSGKKVDWHGHASFQIKMGFLLLGILIFVAWYAWLRMNAS